MCVSVCDCPRFPFLQIVLLLNQNVIISFSTFLLSTSSHVPLLFLCIALIYLILCVCISHTHTHTHLHKNTTCSVYMMPDDTLYLFDFRADHLVLGSQLVLFPEENYFSPPQHSLVVCSSLSTIGIP